jgi:tripartite-type tricarboxylate transporter receptor subunit TctC
MKHAPAHALAITALLLASPAAVAKTDADAKPYPSKPVRIIVPAAPGGGTDLVARLIAQRLTDRWGHTVIVENRPGAGGVTGADMVAKGSADGYTLLMNTAGHTITPAITKVPWDPIRDFAPITMVTSQPYMLVVHPSVAAKSAQEFVALAKAKPGQLNYASSGAGGPVHLATELFKTMTGTDLVHIPYKGVGPAQTELIGGQVQMMFTGILPGMPHVKTGKLRALAVTSAVRSGAVPELPTVAETVAPGYEVLNWFGLLGPAATPPAVIQRVHTDVSAILRSPDMAERMQAEGLRPGGNTPEQFNAQLKTELAKWARVVKQSGIRVE